MTKRKRDEKIGEKKLLLLSIYFFSCFIHYHPALCDFTYKLTSPFLYSAFPLLSSPLFPLLTPFALFSFLYLSHSALRYSRVPVYRGDIDHIVGIVYSKDLLEVSRGERE